VAEELQVRFGAETAGYLAGAQEVKSATMSLVQDLNAAFAHSAEAIRLPLDALAMMKSSLRETAEVAGVVFAFEKLKEFAESMAELGEKTLNSAYILGLSVEEYARLSGAIRIFGGDADAVQRPLERLALNIQRVAEGNKTAVAAFHNLGVSTEEVKTKGDNLVTFFTSVIQHYAELEPAARNIGILHEVAGRGVDRFAGAMRHGVVAFQEAMHASDEYAAAIKKNADGMDETAEKTNKLGLDLSTLAVQGFGTLKPLIDGTISALDGLVRSMTTAIGWVGKIATAVGNAAADFIHWTNAILGVSQALDATSEAAERNRQRRGLGTEDYGYADIPPVTVTGTRKAGTESSAGGGKKGSDDRMSVWRDELRQRLEAEGNFFNDSKAEELAFWQQKLATISSGSQNDLKLRREVNAQIFALEKGLAHQTEQDAIEEQTYKARVADVEYAGKKAHLDAEVKLGRMSADEAIAQEKMLLDEKQALDEGYFNAKLAAAEKDSRTSKKILEEEYLAYQEYTNKLQALDDKLAEEQKRAADKAARPFIQGFDQIGSSFDSLITGMITHTSTLRQGLKRLWDTILGDFIKMISEMVSRWAAAKLMDMGFGAAAGPGAGLGSVLGSGFSSLFGGGLGGLFGGGGGLLSWGESIPFMLPLAERGWVVPSFQSGGIVGQLHSREMVLPADISEGMQGIIRRGGTGGTINIHAIDTQAGAQFLMNNRSTIGQAFRQASLTGGVSPRQLSTGR